VGLKIILRGGIWQIVGTVAGRRVRVSSRTGDRRAAEAQARALERDAWSERPAWTFADAALSYLQGGGDPRFTADLIRHFGGTPLAEILPGNIRDAAPILLPGRKPATWNRQVVTPAQAIINHGADRGMCAPIRVKRFPVKQARARPAGDRAWLDAFRSKARPEIAALALFMFVTGARVGEALRLPWSDFDAEHRLAWLDRTKTRPRMALLTAELAAEMAALKHGRPTVFRWRSESYVHRLWRETCARAEIAVLTPQEAGRRGFATEAIIRQGIDPKTAAALGGWASPRIPLEIYATANPDLELVERVFGAPATHKAKKP
jgi:integrase